MNESYRVLRRDLESIGVCFGDTLIIHSSFKSMGHVEGGAECVFKALGDAVGETGTLIFPTFTYSTSYASSYYSNKETPSCVGLLSETFRKMEGVTRTNHPTHSVAIRGALVREFTENEEADDTPMGPNSPIRRLAQFGAKILVLGCPISHTSYMHAIEEESNSVYALRGHQDYTVVDADGKTYKRSIRRHNFVREDGNVFQRYERLLDILDEKDYTHAFVHGAEAYMIDASALREKALKKMAEDPLYFVDDPYGHYPEYR